MSRRRFAVVVASHRMYETMERCLAGFQAVVANPEDLVFVDNGSGGDLTRWGRERFPGITFVTLNENRLFCGGYNAGIRVAMERGHEFVLIVNADTEVVNPGFIEIAIEAMDRHSQAAFIGPLVFYREMGVIQTTCLRFPSVLRSIVVWLPFRLAPSVVSRQPGRETQVEFLNGVCVLCRVDALRNFGLMDEAIGAYVEDTDWSWRARSHGWESWFVPVTSVVHHEEAHGYEHHSVKSFLLKRNTVYWFVKVGMPFSAYGYAAAAAALAWMRALGALTTADRQARIAFATALIQVYRSILARRPLGSWFGPPLAQDGGAARAGWTPTDGEPSAP